VTEVLAYGTAVVVEPAPWFPWATKASLAS